ncbi:MAG: tyrosine-type recombinase/integrase [Dehalococcoidales bacterium]|nr:tyrosine-type recombinase/integrase [Dehalococcoidales bacterium]
MNHYFRKDNPTGKPILSRHAHKPKKKQKYKPKIPKRLLDDEVKSLLKALNNRRDKLAVIFCLNTGLRVGELVGLIWGDVWDFKLNIPRQELLVRSEIAKGKKERFIPLNRKATASLQALFIYNHTKSTSDVLERLSPLLRGMQGKHISRRQFQRIIKKAREDAGLNRIPVTPHKLRHTFATNIYKKTNDLISLQELLGHSNLNTTRIYAHIGNEEKRNAVNKL